MIRSSLLTLFLAACCAAPRTAGPAPEPAPEAAHEVVTEPPGGEPSGPSGEVAAAIDCAREPAGMCCMAMTPECNACRENAMLAQAQWEEKCGPPAPPPADPLPATYDCSAPAPLTPCCRALLPKCTRCVERNKAVAEAYRAQCPAP